MAPEFGKPIHHLPLIPANVLKKHRVHEPLDPRFRSAARLLQALWREDRDLPIGPNHRRSSYRRQLLSSVPMWLSSINALRTQSSRCLRELGIKWAAVTARSATSPEAA